MRSSAIGSSLRWGIAAGWLALIAAGLGWLSAYASQPGAPAQAPASWPASAGLVLDTATPTLVMIAHPKCDCTRASVAELRELVGRAPGSARIYVVFVAPFGADPSWLDTALWQSARAIPGATALRDNGGRLAERFGAWTSGQTLLYGADGRLLFAGGATIARGHEGDNPGFRALLALVRGQTPASSESPVFGCPLFDPPAATADSSRRAL